MKKIFLLILPASFITLLAYYYVETSQPKHLQQLKRQPLLSSFTSKGLVTKLIDVQIKYDEVKDHSEEAEIKAYVTLPFDLKGPVRFRWKFGENVVLVEGLTNGSLDHFVKDEAQLISIKVKGFSPESNRHIGFEATGVHHGRGIYGESLVASDLENTFENVVQNVERIKAEK